MRGRGRRTIGALALIAALAAAGCGDSVDGVERAGKAELAVDIYGCPDLDGLYAFVPPAAQGMSSDGSLLSGFEVRGGVAPTHPARALAIRRTRPGIFEFRFIVDHGQVLRQLGTIRRFERERYREWYRLIHEPSRSAYIAIHGEEGHARRLRDLGPTTEVVRELRAGTSAACRDGWLELSRTHGGPIRLTRGEDGSVLGRAKELNTFDIPIWCGDGCKDIKIPTGSYTSRLRWLRDGSHRPWQPGEPGDGVVFERPLDDIEAEQRAQAAEQRRIDAQRFLDAEAIRARIAALAPAGTEIDTVQVRDGKVHVRYRAPVADSETLLQRVAEAGGGRMIEGPLEVERGINPRRPGERSVAFVLTESALVRRRPAPKPILSGPGADPVAGMAVLAAADPTPPAIAPVVRTPPAPIGAKTPPLGVAGPMVLQRRVGALFPQGCRIVDVGYGDADVVLSGQAEQSACISAGLRALEVAGSRPELLSIMRDGDRTYAFRIRIASSSLTRP